MSIEEFGLGCCSDLHTERKNTSLCFLLLVWLVCNLFNECFLLYIFLKSLKSIYLNLDKIMLHAPYCIFSNRQSNTTLTLLNVLFYLLFPKNLAYLICLITLTFLDLFIWIPFTLKAPEGYIRDSKRLDLIPSLKIVLTFYRTILSNFVKFSRQSYLRSSNLVFTLSYW